MSFRLYADYNHSGRVNRTPDEHDQRLTPPGAIVLPNFDADGRRLPRTVRPRNAPVLDVDRRSKRHDDDDLTPVFVQADPDRPLTSNESLVLRVVNLPPGTLRFFDDSGQPLRRVGGQTDWFRLPPFTTRLELGVEATIPSGVPSSQQASRSSALTNVGRIQLLRVTDGTEAIEDEGLFSVAPLILLGDTARADRVVYACEIFDQTSSSESGSPTDEPLNEPTLRDLSRGLNAVHGVKLDIVPQTISSGDSWLQDQFQLGYCEAPNGSMQMLLHLPRARSNYIQSLPGPNLSSFVTSHFPSRDVGVVNDFVNRVLPVRDVDGHKHRLTFSDSYSVFAAMGLVYSLRAQLLRLLKPDDVLEPQEFWRARLELGSLLGTALTELEARRTPIPPDADPDSWDEYHRNWATSLKEQYERTQDLFPLRRPRLGRSQVGVRVVARQDGREPRPILVADLTNSVADQLYRKLRQWHDSANYGGNIEVSPPTRIAPWGKVVVGNAYENGSGSDSPAGQPGSDVEIQRDADTGMLLDVELLGFLQSRGVQPVVEVFNGWLEVGHVDEILTFVSGHRSRRFTILRASPRIALDLLRAALDVYIDGLPAEVRREAPDILYQPIGNLHRPMLNSDTPLTQLLRGKQWLHHHPRGSFAKLEPPLLYRNMQETYLERSLVAPLPYRPGEGADRRYPADLNVLEALYFGTEYNEHCEEEILGKFIDPTLETEFPETSIVGVPVLFDVVPNRETDRTSAFTPNLVNMQVVNGHVFVPRPYGPRMRPMDAITVLKSVLDTKYHARLTPQFFRQTGLDRTVHWARRPLDPGSGFTDAVQLAEQFRDGFREVSTEDIAERIVRANQGAFVGGDLKPGWHRLLIPEGTVDLFQAYTHVILAALGLRVHWVDSWYYHVRLGEIHCGTNVLRRPLHSRRTSWWDDRTLEFEEETIRVGRSPS